MKTSFFNSQKLPLVIEPDAGENFSFASIISTCGKHREFFRAKLLEHGALLFRGCLFASPAEFGEFVHSFSGKKLLAYVGGASPRVELGGGVYTSTEYPSQYVLALHNELSYSHQYPANIYFCCLIAPQNGGETPIADSRAILKKINPEIVREFKKRKSDTTAIFRAMPVRVTPGRMPLKHTIKQRSKISAEKRELIINGKRAAVYF